MIVQWAERRKGGGIIKKKYVLATLAVVSLLLLTGFSWLYIQVESLNRTLSVMENKINDLEIRNKWLNESLTILNETQLKTVAYIVYGDEERFYAIDGATGVICYNETDAYTVIQKAINQTRTNGGGTVLLKEGVYPITTTLELMEGVSLCGAGEQSTVLTTTSPITMMRTIRNNYAKIKDIHLNMSYDANIGMVISDTWYNDIHVEITYLKAKAIGVQVQVTQNEWGSFYNKIWVNIDGKNDSTSSIGILLQSSVNVTPNFNYFTGHIRDVDIGMKIIDGKEQIVEHLDVVSCNSTGYYIGANRSLFIGCYSENNGKYGYFLCNNTYATVIGGYTGGNGKGNFGGATGSQYIIVGGNKMEFKAPYGTESPKIIWTEEDNIQLSVHFENGSIIIYNESTDKLIFKIYPSGDIELCQLGAGIILRSENGTAYRVYIDDEGNLQTEPYP